MEPARVEAKVKPRNAEQGFAGAGVGTFLDCIRSPPEAGSRNRDPANPEVQILSHPKKLFII
jgi:hypothetical protein